MPKETMKQRAESNIHHIDAYLADTWDRLKYYRKTGYTKMENIETRKMDELLDERLANMVLRDG